MKSEFTIGVFGIIFDSQKLVLLCHRRDYDLWNLPGGGLEAGESPLEGVKREVKEETGLDVEVSKLVGVYSKETKNEIVFAFVCDVTGGQITLNKEADKIEYFEINRLPANTVPKQVERIHDAVRNSPEVIFKIQAGQSSIELVKRGEL